MPSSGPQPQPEPELELEPVRGTAATEGAAAAAAPLRVELLVCAEPGAVRRQWLTLAAGATVADALREGRSSFAGLAAEAVDALWPSVWGRACVPGRVLADGDRLLLTRGLQVDPKEARRLRYQRDGLRPQRRTPRRRGEGTPPAV
ncbi:MAG: hypothetical protein RL223_3762 [Pseudomonadota bacterium]